MNQPARATLLIAAALLMVFGAFGDALVVVPDLHGDLVEIGVRPTVVGGTVLRFYFGIIASFGLALMVAVAAVQAMRGIEVPRIPLAIVAAIYTIFGVIAFSRSHNLHHLGPVAMGVLLGAALAIPSRRPT